MLNAIIWGKTVLITLVTLTILDASNENLPIRYEVRIQFPVLIPRFKVNQLRNLFIMFILASSSIDIKTSINFPKVKIITSGELYIPLTECYNL